MVTIEQKLLLFSKLLHQSMDKKFQEELAEVEEQYRAKLQKSKLDFDNCPIDEVSNLEKRIIENIISLIDICNENSKKLIIVSNETGLGVVPSYYMGNYFRDISGRTNNRIGQESDFMYFIFSGIPIKLKHKGEMVKWPQDF